MLEKQTLIYLIGHVVLLIDVPTCNYRLSDLEQIMNDYLKL